MRSSQSIFVKSGKSNFLLIFKEHTKEKEQKKNKVQVHNTQIVLIFCVYIHGMS